MAENWWLGPVVLGLLIVLAAALMRVRPLRSYAFPVWVFASVGAGMFYPATFQSWGGFDLKLLIVPLIQIITFGMGTTLSTWDFARIFRRPWPVLLGMLLQFTIMPLVGLLLASAFRFEADVAAGCVLIGSVPGGVSSNLITYLAGGDVALSVTMTACSTLISPLMTPAMMKLLASRYVEISFSAMALDICNMILAPIVAGLVANKILYGEVPAFRRGGVLGCVALACVAIVAIVGLPGGAVLGSVRGGVIVGTALVGLMALAKLVVEIQLRGPKNWMDHALPLLSMAAICLIMLIIAARSAADLIRVGPLLVTAAMLHNLLGYLLGYWAARLARLDERVCRTVAIEVGLQNGALATGLAINTLRTASAALAAAVFAPWSVISGSLLASWWRRRSTSRGG